jgi:hypothetical protein
MSGGDPEIMLPGHDQRRAPNVVEVLQPNPFLLGSGVATTGATGP